MLIILWGILSDPERDFVNEIFAEYHVRLYNISLQILRSRDDAEDALAQTFLKIMDHIEQIQKIPRHETLPFCVILLKNASVDILRKNKKLVPMDFTNELQELATDTPEDAFFKNCDKERLLELINQLPPEDRYLLELRLGEEMSYKEIGPLLNIAAAAARKRFQRALKKLQKFNSREAAHA